MKRKVPKDIAVSPGLIFILYLLVAYIVISARYFLFPGLDFDQENGILRYFRNPWCLLASVRELILLFPALAISALIIPFGMRDFPKETFEPYSAAFLKQLQSSIFTAITAAVVYAVLSLFVLPLVQGTQYIERTAQFFMAKQKIEQYSASREWEQANLFLIMTERIWPNNPLITQEQKDEIQIKAAQAMVQGENSYLASLTGIVKVNRWQEINIDDILREAMSPDKKERFKTVSSLGSFAVRLLVSPEERKQAEEIVKTSWDKITAFDLTVDEGKRLGAYLDKLANLTTLQQQDTDLASLEQRKLSDDVVWLERAIEKPSERQKIAKAVETSWDKIVSLDLNAEQRKRLGVYLCKLIGIIPNGQWQEIDANLALQEALSSNDNEHFYDATWLASVAERLAVTNAQRQEATRVVKASWDEIASLKLNGEERKRLGYYLIKLAGYNSVQKTDWIKAYYYFRYLEYATPNDPDVRDYMRKTKEGLARQAFFLDEFDRHIGSVQTNLGFSIPVKHDTLDAPAQGKAEEAEPLTVRIAVRTLELGAYSSFATDIEIQAVSNNATAWNVTSHYAKIFPVMMGEKEYALLVLQAIDADDITNQILPEWTGQTSAFPPNKRVLLDITYRDFLLLTKLRTNTPYSDQYLNIGELLRAARFSSYGISPYSYQAELLYRIGEPAIFISLCIFALVLGWRFRTSMRLKLILLPMLLLLPFVFSGLISLCRIILNNVSIITVMSFGFFIAGIMFAIFAVLLFILSLISLASQT
ncbi:hypothetical protein ACYULU_06165 [Breznakiellaceae bacterium SP9]